MKRYTTMAEHNEIGKIGEDLARAFLMKQGFTILDTNYRILQGELDIVAKKDSKIHFVEVKSIKVRDFSNLNSLAVQPEDNLTYGKYSKLVITIDSYLKSRGVPHETRYQLDLACVYINLETREGRVRLMQNILIEQN